MVTMFVKHAVEDFRTWKVAYDGLGPTRHTMGVTGATVHQDPQNANIVTVTHQFDSVEAAKTFANSGELKNAMMKAGVSGRPDIWITNDVEQTAY
jgi:quinol monooxygenase YgiN